MHRRAVARSSASMSILVAACVTASACVLPADLGSNDTGTEGGTGNGSSNTQGSGQTSEDTGADTGGPPMVDDGPAPVGPPKIDILFVFDNSGSMGPTQAALASTIDGLVDALELVDGISYRIGVTTTDNGNPWCGSTSPEAGKLVASSCHERLGQFQFNGNPMADATAVACTEICTLDELPIAPTPVAGDPTPRERPWIEGGNGVTNLEGVAIGDALRCMLPQGIAGCGFESPLESMNKAIIRSATPGEANFGFIRDDAHLAIILVGDELDCSYKDEEEWIFLPEDMDGDPNVFWSDPESTAPTSAVCWNAGAVCEGYDDGDFSSCRAANHSRTDVDVSDEAAVLQPTSRYVDALAGLLAQKRQTADASVFLYGVMGVPVGYPATPIDFHVGESEFQYQFGIGPGCVGPDPADDTPASTGVPPVRQLAVIESFAYQNLVGPQVFSICDADLGGVYGQLVAQLAPYLGG